MSFVKRFYCVSGYNSIFTVPAGAAPVVVKAHSFGNDRLLITENPTIVDGSPETIVNRDRINVDIPQCSVHGFGGSPSGGTPIFTDYGWSNDGIIDTPDFLLKPGYKYTFLQTGSNVGSYQKIVFEWTEGGKDNNFGADDITDKTNNMQFSTTAVAGLEVNLGNGDGSPIAAVVLNIPNAVKYARQTFDFRTTFHAATHNKLTRWHITVSDDGSLVVGNAWYTSGDEVGAYTLSPAGVGLLQIAWSPSGAPASLSTAADLYDIEIYANDGTVRAVTSKFYFDIYNNVKCVKNATDLGTADFNATEKASIAAVSSGLTVAQAQTLVDIKSIVSDGRVDCLVKFVDVSIGSDSNNGDGWATGHPYRTIGKATTVIAAAGMGGYIFVKAGNYNEDVVLPDNVTMIGIATHLVDNFVQILGVASGSVKASLTLGFGSKCIGCRVGKQDLSGYTGEIVAMAGKSEFLNSSTGAIQPVVDCVFKGYGSADAKIAGNWVSGSGKAVNAVAGSFDNSSIIDNAFIEITGDHIVCSGDLVDVDLNSFLDVHTGKYAINSAVNFMAVTHNIYNGAGQFHNDTTALGHDHIVHDNENSATFTQVDFLRKNVTNRKAIKKVLGEFYRLTYDDSDLDSDVIVNQKLQTFDGTTIGDLAGTTKPAIILKSSI